jgi:hypothetical protein
VTRRRLTHGQYEELVSYEHGRPSWRVRSPSPSLTQNGYLTRVPHSGHDRASSMFQITDVGRSALARYREHWGIAEDES